MTSAERTTSLVALGKQIATELRKLEPLRPWTLVEPTEDTYTVYLRNAGKARIYIQFDGYGDKLQRLIVSGYQNIGKNGAYVEVYNRGEDGTGWNRVTEPSITVAVSRGCAAIARDITKRFLPEYLRVFALVEEKVAADAVYEATIAKNRNRLAAHCGVALHADDNGKRTDFSWHHNGYHTVKVSKDNCDLDLNDLTFEQAEHIIWFLKHGK